MVQTIEQAIKNENKRIKIPTKIRPFDVGYRIVNEYGQALALRNGASIFALPSLAEKAIKKEFSKNDPDFDIEKHFVEEVAIVNLSKFHSYFEEMESKMQLRLKELREDLCLSVGQMAKETGVSQNTIHLYERGGYPSIKQIEMIARTYDVNPAWLVGWIDDEMMPAIQVVEKVVYKESPTARLPDYFNNNNDGKIIKWVKSKRYMGGKVWSKRT